MTHTHYLSSAKKIFQTAQQHQKSIVFWRLPFQKKIQAIIQLEKKSPIIPSIFSLLKDGFIFSPFGKENTLYYIQPDIHILFSKKKIKWFFQKNQETLWKKLTIHTKNCIHTINHPAHQYVSTDQQTYVALVKKAQRAIQKKKIQKIVTSTRIVVELPTTFDPVHAFFYHSEKISNGLLVLMYTPSHGIWLGESPEVLFSIDETQKKITTVALAGTQKITKKKSIFWPAKETNEQQIVETYIENFLLTHASASYQKEKPHTLIHQYLAHLQTKYSCTLDQQSLLDLGSILLQKFSPTPAVAGMPSKKAIDFIMQYEKPRSLYTGFWGPIDRKQQSSIFVNLRSMQIKGKKAIIYAGGGITKDSHPMDEWQEVQAKYQSIYHHFIHHRMCNTYNT